MSRHARPGEKIEIKNVNNAHWVEVGDIYVVDSVGTEVTDHNSLCYHFKGLKTCWWGSPAHFDILGIPGDPNSELIAEAARRYPKGTHYLEVASGRFGTKQESKGSTPSLFDYIGQRPRIMVQEGGGIVYMDGVWAPIVHPSYQSFQKDDTVVRWRDLESWEWKGIGDIGSPPIGKELQIVDVSKGSGLDKLPSIYIESHGWYPATAFIFSEYYNQSITNRGTADTLNTEDHGKINQGRSIEVQGSVASIVTGQRRAGSRVQGRRDAAVIGRGHLGYKTITGR